MGREETMSWKEAVSLLELTPPADADVVRRTYLRRVKKVRPERDPEGFRRLREAYEMLRWGVFEDDDAPWDDEQWDGDGDEAAAPPAGDTSAELPEGSASLDDGPGETPADPDVTEATADEPDPEEYDASEPYVIRGQIWERASEAHDAAEAGDLARAGFCLESALDLAEEHREPGSLGSHLVLETILRLYSGQYVGAARETFRRYIHLLERTGATLQVLNTDLGARVLLLREMGAFPDDVPPTFHAAIADGVLNDDPARAAAVLAELADAHPLAAITLSDHMATRAPALEGLYGEILRRSGHAETPISESTVSPNGWVWVMLGVVLLRIFLWLVLDGAEDDDAARLSDAAAQVERENSGRSHTEYDGKMPEARDPAVARLAREKAEYDTAVWRLCDASDGLCQSVKEIEETAELGKCDEVRTLARETHRLAFEAGDSLVHELDTVVNRARERCQALAPRGGTP